MIGFKGIVAAGMVVALWGAVGPASADEVTLRWIKASGDVVSEKVLTTEALEAMPQVTFTTNTPWTTKPTEFKGPSIKDLEAIGGVPAAKANVVAINDYSAEIPAEDWDQHEAILAVRVDGETMRIRDKGPYWLMYPIDADPDLLNTQVYHSRMVWQVKGIDFVVE